MDFDLVIHHDWHTDVIRICLSRGVAPSGAAESLVSIQNTAAGQPKEAFAPVG